MKLPYIGQNQDSGLHPKKSGVIFFKAKLLNPKHGVLFCLNIEGTIKDILFACKSHFHCCAKQFTKEGTHMLEKVKGDERMPGKE